MIEECVELLLFDVLLSLVHNSNHISPTRTEKLAAIIQKLILSSDIYERYHLNFFVVNKDKMSHQSKKRFSVNKALKHDFNSFIS
jgi:hypothetical protein